MPQPIVRQKSPEVNRKLRGRVLEALRKAGRPVTRGELMGMYLPQPHPPAIALKATLEAMVDCGMVNKGTERDTRLHRVYELYWVAKADEGKN